jgi:hypothetical protein
MIKTHRKLGLEGSFLILIKDTKMPLANITFNCERLDIFSLDQEAACSLGLLETMWLFFLGFTMCLEHALDFLLWGHKQLSANSKVSQTSS